MAVLICSDPFEPLTALKHHQDRLQPGSSGATATFVGTMRDFNEGDDVQAMTLEHYPTSERSPPGGRGSFGKCARR